MPNHDPDRGLFSKMFAFLLVMWRKWFDVCERQNQLSVFCSRARLRQLEPWPLLGWWVQEEAVCLIVSLVD